MRAKQLTLVLVVVAVLGLALSAALGSSGTTDGDPDTGQQIANVAMPIGVLALLGAAGCGIAWAVQSRKGSGPSS